MFKQRSPSRIVTSPRSRAVESSRIAAVTQRIASRWPGEIGTHFSVPLPERPDVRTQSVGGSASSSSRRPPISGSYCS